MKRGHRRRPIISIHHNSCSINVGDRLSHGKIISLWGFKNCVVNRAHRKLVRYTRLWQWSEQGFVLYREAVGGECEGRSVGFWILLVKTAHGLFRTWHSCAEDYARSAPHTSTLSLPQAAAFFAGLCWILHAAQGRKLRLIKIRWCIFYISTKNWKLEKIKDNN